MTNPTPTRPEPTTPTRALEIEIANAASFGAPYRDITLSYADALALKQHLTSEPPRVILNEAQFAKFMEAIENPAEPTEALKELMRSAAPWKEPEPEASVPVPTPVDEIAAERRRQMEVEGWSIAHDDQYDMGELALAAGCYALHAGGREDYKLVPMFKERGDEQTPVPRAWPFNWASVWWKPKDPRRDLIRAAGRGDA